MLALAGMPRRFPFAGSFCGCGLTWRVSRALKSLDLAGDLDCVIAESLQQPGDQPHLQQHRKPNRRPFDEVVHHGHW